MSFTQILIWLDYTPLQEENSEGDAVKIKIRVFTVGEEELALQFVRIEGE